jgi:hypothetical protein
MVRGAAHLSNVHLNASHSQSITLLHALYCDLARKTPHDSPSLRGIWSCGSGSSTPLQYHSSSFLSSLGRRASTLVTPAEAHVWVPRLFCAHNAGSPKAINTASFHVIFLRGTSLFVSPSEIPLHQQIETWPMWGQPMHLPVLLKCKLGIIDHVLRR